MGHATVATRGADVWDNAGAAASFRQVTTASAKLFTVVAFNGSGAAAYLQVFDSATTPAGGAVPLMTEKIPNDSHGSLDFGGGGRQCRTGIWVGFSTTALTYTAAGASFLIDTGYRIGC